MKKSILAISLAAAMGVPAVAAHASSNVSMYGILDIGYMSISNDGGERRNVLDSGLLQSSRFGFRGSEDLGGGKRAIFLMESGFNLDTGASTSATSFFNRQIYVGLSSSSAGTLTLGRQYTPIYDQLILMSAAPAFGFQSGALDGIAIPGTSAVSRFDNTLSGTRIDNSIKYTSPTINGFKAAAMLGLGEVEGSSSAGRTLSASLGYTGGPLSLGIGYLQGNCRAAAGCGANQDDNKLWAVGGGYDIGVTKLSATYSIQRNARNVRDNDANTLNLLAQVPMGAWQLVAGYGYQNDKSALNQNAKQINLGAQYSLSKRTTLYSMYSNQKVDNGGLAGMALRTSGNDRMNVFGVGLRHRF